MPHEDTERDWNERLLQGMLAQLEAVWQANRPAGPGVVLVLTAAGPDREGTGFVAWCDRAELESQPGLAQLPKRQTLLAFVDTTPATVPVVVLVRRGGVAVYRIERQLGRGVLTA